MNTPRPIRTPVPVRDLKLAAGDTIRIVDRYPDPDSTMTVTTISYRYNDGELSHVSVLAHFRHSPLLESYTIAPDELVELAR